MKRWLWAAAVCSALLFGQRAYAHEGEAAIWSEPSGTGVGLGFSNGIWGGLYAQDVRVRVPFSDYLGLSIRLLALQNVQADPFRMDLGGRVGIQGGSKPLMNFLRVYGSGGLQIAAPITGVDEKKVKFGFGGEFGLEAFLANSVAVFVEIGGNGFIDTSYGAGGVALAGMNFYPY